MEQLEPHTHARQLWNAHGPKAIAEAAQKASALERKGENERAKYWRRIEAFLFQMRGPNEG
jgi:hypothetical protein